MANVYTELTQRILPAGADVSGNLLLTKSEIKYDMRVQVNTHIRCILFEIPSKAQKIVL